jgi:hypothetical protein
MILTKTQFAAACVTVVDMSNLTVFQPHRALRISMGTQMAFRHWKLSKPTWRDGGHPQCCRSCVREFLWQVAT